MMKIVYQWFKRLLSPLFLLVPIAVFFNIWDFQRLGYGNTYYAAGIKSMLTNFRNFFFVSFDATGYISIDKAPLSLWVDTIFAKIFGFSGWSILLPHALEGLLVTLLVYHIVYKISGKWPAFLASLAITLSPVNVAVYRNNTPDALLLVFMLLAINFLTNYLKDGKWKSLFLTALMIGLGFNTKMMQAFLILPAMCVVIMLFDKRKFWSKMGRLAIFLGITAMISFSWITIVDLTPKSMRPYVGSSSTNSAWELAFGYNGIQRLLGESDVGGRCGFKVGKVGLTRLFTGEMSTQTGWFLGSALLYSAYFLIRNLKRIWKKQFVETDLLTVLAIVFLITQFVFFSYAEFFHSYYLNIFAVPIALLIGLLCKNEKEMWVLLFVSVPLQINIISQAEYSTWLIPVIMSVTVASILLCVVLRKRKQLKLIFISLFLCTLYLAPCVWSYYTTILGNTVGSIFIGGPNVGGHVVGGNMGMGGGVGYGVGDGISNTMLEYLKKNNGGEKYFVAVDLARQASGLILNENIGNVMNIGGYSGRDVSIALNEFIQMIADGDLRYIILNSEYIGKKNDGYGYLVYVGGSYNGNSDITTWVQDNATLVLGTNDLYDLKGATTQIYSDVTNPQLKQIHDKYLK